MSATVITQSNSSRAHFDQRIGSQTLDQFLAQRQQDRRVARGVFELRFRELEVPVAEPLSFIDRLVQITRGDCLQSVALFNVAGANQLARQQRVEKPAEISAQVCLINFASNFALCAILIGTMRGEQIAQRRERGCFAKIAVAAIAKRVEVDDVNAAGRGELDQAQPPEVRIKLGGFGVESDCLVGRQRFDCFAQLFLGFD